MVVDCEAAQCFAVSGVQGAPTGFNVELDTNTDMQMSLHLLVIPTGTNWALVLLSALYCGNNTVTIGKINYGSATTWKNKHFLLRPSQNTAVKLEFSFSLMSLFPWIKGLAGVADVWRRLQRRGTTRLDHTGSPGEETQFKLRTFSKSRLDFPINN